MPIPIYIAKKKAEKPTLAKLFVNHWMVVAVNFRFELFQDAEKETKEVLISCKKIKEQDFDNLEFRYVGKTSNALFDIYAFSKTIVKDLDYKLLRNDCQKYAVDLANKLTGSNTTRVGVSSAMSFESSLAKHDVIKEIENYYKSYGENTYAEFFDFVNKKQGSYEEFKKSNNLIGDSSSNPKKKNKSGGMFDVSSSSNVSSSNSNNSSSKNSTKKPEPVLDPLPVAVQLLKSAYLLTRMVTEDEIDKTYMENINIDEEVFITEVPYFGFISLFRPESVKEYLEEKPMTSLKVKYFCKAVDKYTPNESIKNSKDTVEYNRQFENTEGDAKIRMFQKESALLAPKYASKPVDFKDLDSVKFYFTQYILKFLYVVSQD